MITIMQLRIQHQGPGCDHLGTLFTEKEAARPCEVPTGVE